MAEMTYSNESEGDDIAPAPVYVAILDPVPDEAMISEAMGISVDEVRAADHIEMVHERELAPGTPDIVGIHRAIHQGGYDGHTHAWEAHL